MAVFRRSGAKHRHRIECGAASRKSPFGTEPTIQNVRREVWFRSKTRPGDGFVEGPSLTLSGGFAVRPTWGSSRSECRRPRWPLEHHSLVLNASTGWKASQ